MYMYTKRFIRVTYYKDNCTYYYSIWKLDFVALQNFKNLHRSRFCSIMFSVPFSFFFFFNSSHLIFKTETLARYPKFALCIIVHTHYIQISNREIVMIFSRAKNIRDKTSKRDESHAWREDGIWCGILQFVKNESIFKKYQFDQNL